MAQVNFHIHSTGSDGKLTPKEIIELSIGRGLKQICFTDHFKRPFEDTWSKNFFSEDYLDEIKRLKLYYKDKIDISFGAEFDWFEGYNEWYRNKQEEYNFDFILGSVHKIISSNGEVLSINVSEELLNEAINKLGGIKSLVKKYYRQIRLMSESKFIDSIAHMDVIKTFNQNNKFFNEKDSWYTHEIIRTLKTIKKSKIAIELNTSGYTYPCNEIFPSPWIIKEAGKLGIPITIGSDCHLVHQIDFKLDDAINLAKKSGFKSILIFKNRKPIKIKI
jgi:histidinol-phosphatase (PHP family)